VYRLKNALYRLKQALRAWYSQIDGHFDEKCFLKSKNEPTLLVKRQGVDDILIAFYVDNFVFTKNNERMIKEFKKEMMKKYEISDLGLLNHFIGMGIYQREKGVIICQKKYVENVLKNSKYMVVI
jgi:hypothetical protein